MSWNLDHRFGAPAPAAANSGSSPATIPCSAPEPQDPYLQPAAFGTGVNEKPAVHDKAARARRGEDDGTANNGKRLKPEVRMHQGWGPFDEDGFRLESSA